MSAIRRTQPISPHPGADCCPGIDVGTECPPAKSACLTCGSHLGIIFVISKSCDPASHERRVFCFRLCRGLVGAVPQRLLADQP